MNFMSNVLDNIPVVGHVKGIIHYAVGDENGGDKAMYRSTKTTAVLARGAIEGIATPVSTVLGAVSGSPVSHSVPSFTMAKRQGFVEHCANTSNIINNGTNLPTSFLTSDVDFDLDGVRRQEQLDILDAIPVVGHVKGVVHYATGDKKGGDKAMYQSSKTTAVLAGGAIGSLAGPGGAAVGAMCGGVLSDCAASLAADESLGIIKQCENMGSNINKCRNPTTSMLITDSIHGIRNINRQSNPTKISPDTFSHEKVKRKTKKKSGLF